RIYVVACFSPLSSRLIALHADTGAEIYKFDAQANSGKHRQYYQHRGVSYWRSKTGQNQRILYGTFDGRLIALDANTGKPCADFGRGGTVDLRAGLEGDQPAALYSVTSAPATYKDLVITGSMVREFP